MQGLSEQGEEVAPEDHSHAPNALAPTQQAAIPLAAEDAAATTSPEGVSTPFWVLAGIAAALLLGMARRFQKVGPRPRTKPSRRRGS